MRTIQLEKTGNPAEILNVVEKPKPQPAAEEVLVKIIAAPVNPSDISFVQGRYGIRPELPSGAGFEGVGTIEAAGADVRLPVGSRVSFTAIGSWGEYAVVNQKAAIPLPDAIPDDMAAQLFVNPFTAWAMVEESGVKEGEWLMITACGSAYGKLVIQLCRKKGIKTVGTVRRDGLNEDLKKLGLDEVVNTETEDLPKRVNDITGGKGVRCVVDSVGGTTTEAAMKCVGQGGKMLIFGLLSQKNPRLDVGLMIFKEITIQGFWLTEWMRKVDTQTRNQTAQGVIGWLASGEVKLPVEATYGLDEIVKAVEHADAPGRWGKILIKP
ncbi:zinc-dependent alcohol dehydrogenase family protein [Persicitalea jodogahamensis]|uniref:Alcohol dehydrogenase n=1 Tax=Persicitalea jodogahamensis TaxID=402147 RepID=A0A8J3DD04_9BACT|nr:zinc-dependent alcohol dehydrogenase family protein [Persicitalea jodogahamensis]GHB84241.1 alcohol dehydrogenase [Persicitalea jodogahamensis]